MNLLAPRGRFDEAEEEIEKAVSLDPISAPVGASQGVLAHFRRDQEAALAHFDEVERLHPEFAAVWFFRGQALDAAGRPAEAIASFERALEETGGTAEMITALGHALATAGREGEARECLARLRSRDSWVSPCLRAQVLTALGETGAALAQLEAAADLHAPDLAWIGVRPTFDPIREEPQFEELMRCIGPSPSCPEPVSTTTRETSTSRTRSYPRLSNSSRMMPRRQRHLLLLRGKGGDPHCGRNPSMTLPPRPRQGWRVGPRKPVSKRST